MVKDLELYNYMKDVGILKYKRYKSFEVDYHNFSYPSMTKDQRRKFDIGDIYLNAAKCLDCGWFIRSKNRHNYVTCKCGKTMVDGGSWYCRRSGNNREDIIVYFDDVEVSNDKEL